MITSGQLWRKLDLTSRQAQDELNSHVAWKRKRSPTPCWIPRKRNFPTTEHMQESSIEEAEACLAREHLAATKVVPLP